ncbi:MAG TPA: hypothetical protein VMT34_11260, partial [Aggregatilineales bacterium]|nr:hypothetical protein [Aggregatilineales bacterium]
MTHFASYQWHVLYQVGHQREGVTIASVPALRLAQKLDRALDRLEQEPHSPPLILDGQAALLEDYLTIRPENFERIEALVQARRLLVGPWYVESVFTGPELAIRNLMLGLRTAHVFGSPLRVGYMPWAIHLPHWLPGILCGFGIDTVLWGDRQLTWDG